MLPEHEDSVAGTEKDESQTASQTDGAQDDDIDAYLKEFEGADDDDSKPGQTEDTAQLALRKAQTIETELANQRFRQDMDSAIAKIRGEVDADFLDDTMVEGWINAEAARDERVRLAFMKRHQNPGAYQKVIGGLASKFQGKFSNLPDKGITEDRQAVASAVRGASKPTPETDDDIDRAAILALPPHEFEKWKREQSAKVRKG